MVFRYGEVTDAMASSNPAAEARFGWQGIAVDVPRHWELHRFYGNRASGYCALDDGSRLRLQLRWEKAVGPRGDVDAALHRYGKGLSRTVRGGQGEFSLFPLAPKALNPDSTASGFHWKAEDERLGVAWHSASRRRMVFVEVLFPEEDAHEAAAQRILESVRETSPGGWDLWNAYGFAFCVPETYTLDASDLVPGRLRYLFRAGRRSWLRIERWAAASVWGRNLQLPDWPCELLKLAGRTASGAVDRLDEVVHGHAACRFAANVSRGILRSPETVLGLVWASPEDDKVFAVWGSGASATDAVDGVAGSVVCA